MHALRVGEVHLHAGVRADEEISVKEQQEDHHEAHRRRLGRRFSSSLGAREELRPW